MSNAVIYYGTPTKAGQTVSEELRSRGINLLRSCPADAYPLVIRNVNTLQYTQYIYNLGAAFKAAKESKWTQLVGQVYYYEHGWLGTPPFMRIPTVVWTYDRNLPTDSMLQIKDRFNANETVAQGKPALAAVLSIAQLRSLVTDTSPIQSTPSSTTVINIDACRVFIYLNRLADLFFRVHQYPLSIDGDTQSSTFGELLQVRMEDIEKDVRGYGNGEGAYKVWGMKNASRVRFNANLPEKNLANVMYHIMDSGPVTGEKNIIFPFVSALCKEDHNTVILVLTQYLFPLLGPDEETAREMLQTIKSGWGVLRITQWGDELAHLYSCIRLCLETGAMARIITTPNNVYQGFVLIGGGYELHQFGIPYEPMSNEKFVAAFHKASPHAASLLSLLDMIQYPSDIERVEAARSINTIAKLAADIRLHGYNAIHREKIMTLARNLVFPIDNPLAITAVNVARIFNLMAAENTSAELLIPMHHLALLEMDRKKRLLSAFGAAVPSFLVPGGRKMDLDGQFEYAAMVKGKREMKATTHVFCMPVPFQKGCIELDQMLTGKYVTSPIGTPLAGRASSFSMIREFTGAGGVAVLGALRSVCGVSMSGMIDSGMMKRKREDDTEDKKGKRRALDF